VVFSNHGLQLQISRTDYCPDFQILSLPEVACLDYDKLQFPLVLRSWRAGERFCPLGMSQQKKISDFLNDQKIPLNLKNKVWVLCSGDHIAWVVGLRVDNRFRITDRTRKVYQLTMKTI